VHHDEVMKKSVASTYREAGMISLNRNMILFAMLIAAAAPVACLALQSPPTRRISMRCCNNRTPVLSQTTLQLSNYIEDAIDNEEVFVTKSPLTDEDIESVTNNNNKIMIDESINKQAGLLANINSERTLGILVLLTVPLAWGTYSPVVKYMYDKMNPSMPGFVFSAGYYIVAAVSLGILSSMQVKNGEMIQTSDYFDNGDNESITTRGGLELGSYLFIGNGLQVVGLQSVPADRAGKLCICISR